jgi:hypothetical protein
MRPACGPARALVLALLLMAVPVASADADNDLGLVVGSVEPVAGVLATSYSCAHPLTPRLEETLLQGMPATVTCEVGLWRRRAFWFDKLVLAVRSERKVVYDLWGKEFRVRLNSNPPRVVAAPDLDSLSGLVFSERMIPVAEQASLDSTAKYYVSVRVTIRPLSPEDLGDVENWLAGDSTRAADAPKGIPHYLLDLTANLSGLGERTAIAKGEPFVPARLAGDATRE